MSVHFHARFKQATKRTSTDIVHGAIGGAGLTSLLSESRVRPNLYQALCTLAMKHQVPGAQLAIHFHGQTEVMEFGQRSVGEQSQVTRATAFPVGSITKSFTATAAMILVADGDLELDAPIGGYLPDLKGLCAQITLSQLLSHTSGLGSGAIPGTVSTVSLARYVAEHCLDRNLVLAPGTGFSYSNTGFILAGHLIENVTGMNYWEAMESILLRPLGIEPAFVVDPRRQPPQRPLARGYSVNLSLNRTVPVDQSLACAEAPAGALALSAADLLTLSSVHIGAGLPGLLPTRYAERMRQPVPGADPFGLASGWALGLAIYRSGGTDWYGHDGNSNGTTCYLRLNVELGCAIAFTSNANTGVELWRELLGELADSGLPVESPATLPALPVQINAPFECIGTYHNGDVAYVVKSEDGYLHLAVDGGVYARMTCHNDLTFALRMPTSGQQLFCGRFLRDPLTGAIDRIQVSGRLAIRRGTDK